MLAWVYLCSYVGSNWRMEQITDMNFCIRDRGCKSPTQEIYTFDIDTYMLPTRTQLHTSPQKNAIYCSCMRPWLSMYKSHGWIYWFLECHNELSQMKRKKRWRTCMRIYRCLLFCLFNYRIFSVNYQVATYPKASKNKRIFAVKSIQSSSLSSDHTSYNVYPCNKHTRIDGKLYA